MVGGTREKAPLKSLEQLQRTSLLSIAGAVKTTSTKAPKVDIDIRPIDDIHALYKPALAASRLNNLENRIHYPNCDGRDSIQKFISEHVLNVKLSIEREIFCWLDELVGSKGRRRAHWKEFLVVYTDGSKCKVGTVARFLCGLCNPSSSMCTNLQAEILGIARTANLVTTFTGRSIRQLIVSTQSLNARERANKKLTESREITCATSHTNVDSIE